MDPAMSEFDAAVLVVIASIALAMLGAVIVEVLRIGRPHDAARETWICSLEDEDSPEYLARIPDAIDEVRR